MYDLRCTIYDVQCTILKCFVLILLLISCLTIKAQDFIENDSNVISNHSLSDDSIVRLKTPTLLSSKPIDSSKLSSLSMLDDSLSTSSTNKKIKKQKKVDTTHYSPKKAAIWAAGFPGLGQVYNKKYWKLPIVYGVIGTVLYFVVSNGQKLRQFNGYISNVYDSIDNPSPYNTLDLSELETYRNTYRKNVQLASFGTVFAWGLSIVDAVVDAHLHSFDISDKLALKIKPQINYSNFTYYTGIGVNLTFK